MSGCGEELPESPGLRGVLRLCFRPRGRRKPRSVRQAERSVSTPGGGRNLFEKIGQAGGILRRIVEARPLVVVGEARYWLAQSLVHNGGYKLRRSLGGRLIHATPRQHVNCLFVPDGRSRASRFFGVSRQALPADGSP